MQYLQVGDRIQFGFSYATVVEEKNDCYILESKTAIGDGIERIKYPKEGMPKLKKL